MKKTINFIEAVNSGENFRCLNHPSNQYRIRNFNLECKKGLSSHFTVIRAGAFTKEFINSEFEIIEKVRTITESRFMELVTEFNQNDVVKFNESQILFLKDRLFSSTSTAKENNE